MATLRLVLDRLKEVGLKIKLTKCEFLKLKIKFLGHNYGIHTVDDKIDAVSHFKQPKSVDNVRSFLELAGYYRPFIRNFAAIANPLTKLLEKDTPFEWTKMQESSFNQLKEALTKAHILVFPQFTDLFLLCTDASTIGIVGGLHPHSSPGQSGV